MSTAGIRSIPSTTSIALTLTAQQVAYLSLLTINIECLVAEQYEDNMLIRPLLEYSGEMDLEYVPVEQRG